MPRIGVNHATDFNQFRRWLLVEAIPLGVPIVVASCFGVYSLSRQLRSNPDVTVSPNTRGQSPEGRNFGSNQTTFNEKRVSRGRKFVHAAHGRDFVLTADANTPWTKSLRDGSVRYESSE